MVIANPQGRAGAMAEWTKPDFEIIETSLELTAYFFATR
jgi:coenzyme PQQ precursor peptide PqqA